MNYSKSIIIRLFIIIACTVISNSIFAAAENPCLDCHDKFRTRVKSVHAAMALGCPSCHTTVAGKTHPGQKESIVLTQSMPGLCYNCHDESKFKGKAVHQPITGGLCTGCHDPHQSNYPKILLKDIPGLCYNCHKESKFKGGKGHTNIGMCNGCHAPHASNTNKILKSDQPEVCYNCHDKAKFTKKYVHAIIPAGGCTSCHTPHISENPSLLLMNNIYDLCITCHVPQSKGQHITSSVIAGSKRKYHPIRGVTDPRFPGKPKKIPDPNRPGKEIEVFDPANPGKEMTCISCHDPHSSDFRKLFPTASVCKLCHKYF
jgi:predicted CXXCH cytochrome family protein